MITCTHYADLPHELVKRLEGSGLEPEHVYAAVVRALEEDVPGVDVTSGATLDPTEVSTGDLVARAAGVVAGVDVAELVMRAVSGDDVRVEAHVADGQRVSRGDVLLTVRGHTTDLLTAERTALNFLCHLSGVATTTAAWVAAVEDSSAKIRDTRKTLPGWRALQKYAVRCGGGVNHRFSLSDRAMVKDNHVVAAGGVVPAYRAVVAANPGLRVEVEVTDLDQLRELLEAGCTEILLDNMDSPTMAEAVEITAGRATLEASGGLTLDRAREVAETGVDFISVGALTHSVRVFDIGFDLEVGPSDLAGTP